MSIERKHALRQNNVYVPCTVRASNKIGRSKQYVTKCHFLNMLSRMEMDVVLNRLISNIAIQKSYVLLSLEKISNLVIYGSNIPH